MESLGFTFFDTAIGRCGVAWSRRGIAGFQLPARSISETRRLLLRRHPGAREARAPAAIRQNAEAIARLLRGGGGDLSAIPLDMTDIPPFHRRVYACVRTIPPGNTLTYGEIAKRLRAPGAARAVGQALARNPFAVIVPCHRVVAAGGRIGGFTAPGGIAMKRRILAAENPVSEGRAGRRNGAKDKAPPAVAQAGVDRDRNAVAT